MNISNFVVVISISAVFSVITTGIILFLVFYFYSGIQIESAISGFFKGLSSPSARDWVAALSGWAAAGAALLTIMVLVNQSSEARKGNELDKLEYIANCKAFHHKDFRILTRFERWDEFEDLLIKAIRNKANGDLTKVREVERILGSVEELDSERITAVKFLPEPVLSKRSSMEDAIDVSFRNKKEQIDLFLSAANDSTEDVDAYALKIQQIKNDMTENRSNHVQYVKESIDTYMRELGMWYSTRVYPKHIQIQQTVFGTDSGFD